MRSAELTFPMNYTPWGNHRKSDSDASRGSLDVVRDGERVVEIRVDQLDRECSAKPRVSQP